MGRAHRKVLRQRSCPDAHAALSCRGAAQPRPRRNIPLRGDHVTAASDRARRPRSERIAQARERLVVLQERLGDRRAGIELLRAQIAVLAEEAKAPPERQGTGTGDLETDSGKPSYALAARLHRRANTTGVNTREGLREPILDLYTKTAGRAFAAANGVAVPAELGRWADPNSVDWDSLPDRFVLKSSRGGGGISVVRA